jgi:hypothetical protein
MNFAGDKPTSRDSNQDRITPELVRAIAERVYALLLRERELEAERARRADGAPGCRGGYR